jgi:lipopolysaccharide/colanic/teichoic acid biosynthesis glycosyltransferase
MGKLGRVLESGPRRHGVLARRVGICSPEVFQALILHERARVDRDGSEFSLVVFPAEARGYLLNPVMRTMRSIDEVGWLDERTIGVLLPITSLEGAQVFARRIQEGLATCDDAQLDVFSYPRHWYPESGDEREGRGTDSEGMAILTRLLCRPIPRWKRVVDIAGSLLALVVCFPLMLLLAAYIKIVSPGPILFRHERVGLHGRTFQFLKFRTMRWGNDQNAHKEHIVAAIRSGSALQKLDDRGDPRIIRGGRFMRMACIDELPQFINVLRGEMSLVGPRPCMPYEAAEFLRWHAHRFDVLPGITGLWQVSGKNKLSFSQMIRLDISYTEHISFAQDVGILARTVPAILKMVAEAVTRKLSPAITTRAAYREETKQLIGS